MVDANATTSSLLGWSKITCAMYLIVIAVILMIVSMIAGHMLRGLADHPEIATDQTPAFALMIVEHPYLYGLTLLPAVGFGVCALALKTTRTLWLILGVVALIIPPVLLIATFVMLIAPMYQSPAL